MSIEQLACALSTRRGALDSARLRRWAVVAGAGLLATGAQAHGGADAGAHHAAAGALASWWAGFSHPYTGLDHLAAMLAVGLWSAMTARNWWRAPAAFAVLLGLGAVLAWAGLTLPAAEPMIAASLVVTGLLVTARLAMPQWAAAALVGGFALFHGAAHGTELTGCGAPLLALIGMVMGTMGLHLIGATAGLLLRGRGHWLARMAGAAVGAFGLVSLLPALGLAI